MRATRSFIGIAVVLLIWNLIGVAAFVMQYTADLHTLARIDPTTARAFATIPGWAWASYALAVGAGTMGAIAMLARRATAAPLFLLSLVAVLIQFAYTFLGTDLLALKGWTVTLFPAFIIAVAAIQWSYARSLVAKRLLR